MKTELCRVATDDGLQLDGALRTPAAKRHPRAPVDALLLVHCTGGNFYSPGVLETFARSALSDGIPVLRVNTRGHDGIASIPKLNGASTKGGAAFETVSQCVFDLKAWLGFLSARGFGRIALVGHSMGAVKCLHFLIHAGHPAVRCLVAISPPRFCHEHWMNHPQADPFRTSYATARIMADDGRGGRLMSVRQPVPLILTAETFLDKYGPEDRYDYLPHLPGIDCPVLVLLGTLSVDSSPAFDSLPSNLQRLADEFENLEFRMIGGADTMYTNRQEEPYLHANPWLAALAHRDGDSEVAKEGE